MMVRFSIAPLAALALWAAAILRADDLVFFENKIRPLLVEHCYECHSSDQKQKGGLLLDSRDGLLKGGDTGPALAPGDPAKSLIIQAIRHEGDLKMPPKKKLSDEQVTALEEWVRRGAPDPRSSEVQLTVIEQHLEKARSHWSFQPVQPLKAEESIDALAGTVGRAPAAPRVRIRRAYFDLIGLPPPPEAVDAFAADPSPAAWKKVIEALLADPRYGERWGRHWLDVARYADNMGAIFNGDDTYPNAWTYRDYVIQSFNEDKPYDQFLREQIAADLLPTAKDVRTLAGLAFLGIGTRKDRRLDDDTLDDTLDVIGRGMLGLSIACARCHDHKLEPITTQDYYGLHAILRSSKEPEVLPELPSEDTAETREYGEKNRAARAEYIRILAFEADRSMSLHRSRLGDHLHAAHESALKNIYEDKTVAPRILEPRRLSRGIHNRLVASWKKWVEAHPELFTPWLELSAIATDADFPAKAADLCAVYGKNENKKLLTSIARAMGKAKPQTLRDVADVYNHLYSLQIEDLWGEKWRGPLLAATAPTEHELGLPLKDLETAAIDRLHAVQSALTLPEADDQALFAVLIEAGSPFVFSGKDFISNRLSATRDVADGLRRNATKGVSDLQNHPGAPARAMAWAEAEKMYDGKVFIRGNPSTPGAPAPRQFLTVLRQVAPEPFPKDQSGRLQLAEAIASPRNPLTARVIVNRVWAWHFGAPLVGSPSDFGFRGDPPSNQPLLDHLAAWFMDNGWSFKKLHRYLMLTDAYQRADLPIRPLEMEPFRDAVLAVSGRLTPGLYGKPEKIADSTRRTIYSYVDRKAQPAIFRSFDFPNPSFSAPQRSRTALAPRALVLLNSPLLVDSAKALAAVVAKAGEDDAARIAALYRRVLQRPPTDAETSRALDYLARYPEDDVVHPESLDWQYGLGEFDAEGKVLKSFSSLTQFDGRSFKGNGVMIDAMGGDPGVGDKQSTVRRWVAPLDGQIDIHAELIHMDEKSDGVIARIVSSRGGLLGEWTAKQQALCTDLSKVSVEKGETLDFVVSSVNGKNAAAYQWSPGIVMPGAEMPAMPGMPRRWDARVDFANPGAPAKPLTALEELCQTLLLSPEFAVLE